MSRMIWERIGPDRWQLTLFSASPSFPPTASAILIRRDTPDYYEVSALGEVHPDGASDLPEAKRIGMAMARKQLEQVLARLGDEQ